MDNTWREELAWAAGFFDGEGCFRKHSGKYAQVTVNQIHPDPLERLRLALCGLGKVQGPYQPTGTRLHGEPRSLIWYYRCTKWADVQAIYAMLYPFLGKVKREQGHSVLSVCNRGAGGVCKRGHLRVAKNLTKWNQCIPCIGIRKKVGQ